MNFEFLKNCTRGGWVGLAIAEEGRGGRLTISRFASIINIKLITEI